MNLPLKEQPMDKKLSMWEGRSYGMLATVQDCDSTLQLKRNGDVIEIAIYPDHGGARTQCVRITLAAAKRFFKDIHALMENT